jgi:ribosomal protein S18 acetylase RimI-like enzyme
MTREFEIVNDLPDTLRRQTAELYYDAFRHKFEPFARSREKAVAGLIEDLDSERVILAVADGQVLGVAGLNYGGRRLANLRWRTFQKHFGWLSGTIKRLAFTAFMRRQQRGQLQMEGIAVHPDARSMGIGTRLLDEVCAVARRVGLPVVRLEVIDTNPRARALYERYGFEPGPTHRLPVVGRLFGFGAYTTMLKRVGLGHRSGHLTPPAPLSF